MKELQNKINMLSAHNRKMCKDKWNKLNLYSKKIANSHKGQVTTPLSKSF